MGGTATNNYKSTNFGANFNNHSPDYPKFDGISNARVASNGANVWFTGGLKSSAAINEVHKSADSGANWSQVTQTTSFPVRKNHFFAHYDSKLWIMGGSNDTVKLNDVYWSADTDAAVWGFSSYAPWSARENGSLLVYNS